MGSDALEFFRKNFEERRAPFRDTQKTEPDIYQTATVPKNDPALGVKIAAGRAQNWIPDQVGAFNAGLDTTAQVNFRQQPFGPVPSQKKGGQTKSNKKK